MASPVKMSPFSKNVRTFQKNYPTFYKCPHVPHTVFSKNVPPTKFPSFPQSFIFSKTQFLEMSSRYKNAPTF